MEIQELVNRFAEGLSAIDSSGIPFKHYHPGVGPYSETQLIKELASFGREKYPNELGGAKTQRHPDLLIPSRWAIEVKIVRPFGDNGKIAEHWSQNLLHPYEGNTSLIGDIHKLRRWPGHERKVVMAITYSHATPQIDISLIISAFEVLANDLLKLPLGNRYSAVFGKLSTPHSSAGFDIRMGSIQLESTTRRLLHWCHSHTTYLAMTGWLTRKT